VRPGPNGQPPRGSADLHELDPKVVTVWRLNGAFTTAVPAVVAVAVAVILARNEVGGWWIAAAVAGAIAAIGGVLTVVWPPIAFRSWRYAVEADTLALRHGVVDQIHSVIPYFRVQHVDITCGPIERAYGLRRLVLHTAAATTDATLPGISESDAAELRRVILERAGRGDAV
jgi:uncharacterized protein